MTAQTDDGDEMNTVKWEYKIRDYLLAESDVEADSKAEAFLERALEEVAELLASNHAEAESTTLKPRVGDYEAVNDLLSDNVREVEVRANGRFQAPEVTVWLREHPPIWANTATRKEFTFSQHREHYNGGATLAILNVRPF